MPESPSPRAGDGPAVIVEPSHDTPLVWFDVSFRGGAAADPLGVEGLHRHAALLARRGARRARPRRARRDARRPGRRDRRGRVARRGHGVGAARCPATWTRVVELAADVLAAPRFAEDEHARLLRETPQVLDEIRDDDSALATRWFDWLCCPGHAYGRTSLGTEASLAPGSSAGRRSSCGAARWWRGTCVIGLAGDVDDASGARGAAAGRAAARRRPAPPPRSRCRTSRRRAAGCTWWTSRIARRRSCGSGTCRRATASTTRRRSRWPRRSWAAVFRLAPHAEIRARAGLELRRGPRLRRSCCRNWFEIWTAAASTWRGRRSALTLELLADYAAHGPTDDEVDFARSYLVGAMPFHVGHGAPADAAGGARRGVRACRRAFAARLPEALAGLTAADVRACTRNLRPDAAVMVAVTMSEQAQRALGGGGRGRAQGG